MNVKCACVRALPFVHLLFKSLTKFITRFHCYKRGLGTGQGGRNHTKFTQTLETEYRRVGGVKCDQHS